MHVMAQHGRYGLRRAACGAVWAGVSLAEADSMLAQAEDDEPELTWDSVRCTWVSAPRTDVDAVQHAPHHAKHTAQEVTVEAEQATQDVTVEVAHTVVDVTVENGTLPMCWIAQSDRPIAHT